ncbi:carotenoid biosynthesis protein [Nocardia mexicana]|uniref:Putative membrane protein n=1 Tax=Nocardia mexicana TaxID=279262 RepID=A0A370H1J1_9NOCA|nr:carotenoid biosynthesis protein [Nocardia mexicana]RDI49870.1 putative membrane protein [Nocardia mexicana]
MTARRLPALTAIALVLAQIAYPLTSGAGRDRVTVVVVVLSAATALAHAATTRGPRFAAGFVLIVSGLGLAAEILGTASGFPFGCYDYASGRLGPAVAGVPLVVPLAWTGGLYPVWVVAGRLYSRARLRIPMTAVGAVGWDLFLDPQMVADGQWSWCAAAPGLPGLPQIPYTNYLGWLALAAFMAALLELLARGHAASGIDAVPTAVFLWTWLGSTLAHAAFLHLPASAAYGFLGLGILGIPLLAALLRSRHPRRAFGRGPSMDSGQKHAGMTDGTSPGPAGMTDGTAPDPPE